jgi:protein-disulfide isomerase
MNPTQKYTRNLSLITLLSALGAGISIWQTYLFNQTRGGLGSGHGFCNIGKAFDCTAIEMSKYAEIFDGLPLSGLAIAGYLIIFMISLYGFNDSFRQNVRKLLLIFTGIAFVFSIGYLGIMIGIIGKFCLLCLGVDTINLALIILTLTIPQKEDPYIPPRSLSAPQMAGLGVAALIAAFLINKATNPQGDMKAQDINDIVESVLNAPVTPLDIPADTPYMGKADAPITIVKFFDYQCPACRMSAEATHPLFKRYPNEIKMVYFNFPLDAGCNPLIKNVMHEFACEASRVAVCANQQGHFTEAYEILFAHQTDFQLNRIAELLGTIPGIDLEKLKECTNLPSTIEKIKKDVESASKLNIRSTPTFFINGKKLEGGMPTSIWIKILDQMLKK